MLSDSNDLIYNTYRQLGAHTVLNGNRELPRALSALPCLFAVPIKKD